MLPITSRWLRDLRNVGGLFLAGGLMVVGAGSVSGRSQSVAPRSGTAFSAYGKLPLAFELNRGQANQGQSDTPVKFITRGSGYTLFLTDTEAIFSLEQNHLEQNHNDGTYRRISHDVASGSSASGSAASGSDDRASASDILNGPRKMRTQSAVLRLEFAGANKNATLTGTDELPGRTNYLRGNDPAKWTTNIPSYKQLRSREIYRGVDLVYYGNQKQLEYDFVVAVGADARQIRLKLRGARGLHVDLKTGDLVVKVGREEVRFPKPVAYQDPVADTTSGGAPDRRGKHLVEAKYRADSRDEVSFVLGNYDHGQRLVIDPAVSYSTYLGGSSNDYATAIAIDASGDAYVTGYTSSLNFPVSAGAYQTSCGGGCSGGTSDAFVSELDPTGSFLIYSTYLGGSENDYGNGIALDASGDAYVAGQTFSSDFPITPGAFQIKCGGSNCMGGQGFITELNPEGSALVYSTYLGGSGVNQANAIVLDAADDAYVTGYTRSATFPITPGAFQSKCTCGNNQNAFVTELNASGSALIYSSFLGATFDTGYAIALDSSDNAYVTGETESAHFPTTPGAFQTTMGANAAGFITKVNPTGTAMVYSTYLGGTSSLTTPCEGCATGIAVDSSGNAYVGGLTAESNFPVTPGAYQTTFVGSTNGHDAFLTKMNASGTALVYSTYLGGDGDTGATAIALDSSGNLWVRGNTKSTVFPVTPGAAQTTFGGGPFDAFVSELDPTGSLLLYSTYLGGSGTEYGGATVSLAIDSQSPPNVYAVGWTNSTDFPTTAGALQTTPAGDYDAFVAKYVPSPNVGLSPGLNFGNVNEGSTSPPQTITVTNTGNTSLTVTNVSVTGANSGDFGQTNTCSTIPPQSACSITVSFTPTTASMETASVLLTDNAGGSPQAVSLTGVGIGNGPEVILSSSSLTFPVTVVGSRGTAQTVTLSNVGNATLAVASIGVTGAFVDMNTCTNVAAGASCTITVYFKPTAPNIQTGSIAITDNGANSPQSVALSGTGTVVSLSPLIMNFGKITVGQSSSPRTATLINISSAPLAVQIAVSGTNPTEFPETNTCGTSVAGGGRCTISVTFTPAKPGTASASVSITDAGGGSPQTVSLMGAGQ